MNGTIFRRLRNAGAVSSPDHPVPPSSCGGSKTGVLYHPQPNFASPTQIRGRSLGLSFLLRPHSADSPWRLNRRPRGCTSPFAEPPGAHEQIKLATARLRRPALRAVAESSHCTAFSFNLHAKCTPVRCTIAVWVRAPIACPYRDRVVLALGGAHTIMWISTNRANTYSACRHARSIMPEVTYSENARCSLNALRHHEANVPIRDQGYAPVYVRQRSRLPFLG